ncbi:type IV secretory system conjugative DNA transfer family protein [Terrarubrum flagellatum]|uniref:type IV secretory system conjugative DNA transfer family protein n=1 Tax=Terrirubrum flagellatum TaxID=2895980 RepID=UPI0031457015
MNMALNPWNNGLICAATETSDFDIRELRRKRMTIFIGCTIAELAIFQPLIRILLQQVHDLMMAKLPGKDEPLQVLLMLDEFYHVGRMDSLISKITISAGYGFRMAIVLQDLSQLDELYGKSTRITTVSGSQIKLFIQINDLETSEFVSEMLGDTTTIYKTPVVRRGEGIFASRVWAPHYANKPLRSPLELRELPALTAILMLKNSRSFAIGKIRHYNDKPFKSFYEVVRRLLELPRLGTWRDERTSDRDDHARPQAQADPQRSEPPAHEANLIARTGASAKKKPLSLGDAPPTSPGDNCDLRAALTAATNSGRKQLRALFDEQKDEQSIPEAKLDDVRAAITALNDSFGDDGRPGGITEL